jgi:hypothetical protein
MTARIVDVEAMRGHTPGGFGRNIPPASKYPTIFAGRNTHVCVVASQGLPASEIEANANLFASADKLLAEVIERRAQSDEDAYVIEQLGQLLARIAVAVKGPDGELTRHSYHDLPERVEALISERRARDAQVAELLEAADDIVEHGYGMKAKDRLCAALSAIRGGATG